MRGRAGTFAATALAWIAISGCGPKQVCECAVLAGGMAPASEAEAAYRSSEVDRCLARHGGGTTTGCPQPAGMPPMSPPRPAIPDATPTASGGIADDATAAGPGQGRLSCPAAPPASQAPCTSYGRCVYPDTQCVCIGVCHGGAALKPRVGPDPPPQWQCTARPPATRSDGCPGEPPRVETPCAGTKTCSYGLAETGVCWGSTFACDGTWKQIAQQPPP